MLITVKKRALVMVSNRMRYLEFSQKHVAVVLEFDKIVYRILTHTGEVGYIHNMSNIVIIKVHEAHSKATARSRS